MQGWGLRTRRGPTTRPSTRPRSTPAATKLRLLGFAAWRGRNFFGQSNFFEADSRRQKAEGARQRGRGEEAAHSKGETVDSDWVPVWAGVETGATTALFAMPSAESESGGPGPAAAAGPVSDSKRGRESKDGGDLGVVRGVREVARMVLEDCIQRGQRPSALLCAFVVRAEAIKGGDMVPFDALDTVPARELSAFVASVRDRVLAENDPSLETMKLQTRFESSYASELLETEQRIAGVDAKKRGLLARVVEMGTNLQSDAQVAALYRAIFKLLLVGIHESSTDRKVERELAAALESVFPQSNLVKFNQLSRTDKEKHIKELAQIVIGIRLFHRESGTGGAGIVDVPRLALSDAKALNAKIEGTSRSLEKEADEYDAVLRWEDARPGSVAVPVERLIDELANRRQMILLLNQLLHETVQGVEALRRENQSLRNNLATLKSLVGGKSAVPKEKVYPYFINLALAWQAMERERDMIGMRRRVYDEIRPLETAFEGSLRRDEVTAALKAAVNRDADPGALVLDRANFVETIDTRTDEGTSRAFDPNSTSVFRVVKQTTPNFMMLPLEYQGYCPYSLVTQGGVLTPGRPDIGIICYKNQFYSFRDAAAVEGFCRDPERVLAGVMKLVRKRPQFAHLLCVQEQLPCMSIPAFLTDAQLSRGGGGLPSKRSIGTQTPTHFIESNIDHRYCWNEWELRRRALQLANITNKRTSSVQTVNSHFKRENTTQYTLPKPNKDGTMPGQATQTRKSQGTNVPRTKRYLGGLRGRPEGKFVEKRVILDGLDVVRQQ